jgi:hypothetical protein
MKLRFHGRRMPYTRGGIGRVPCSRCGKPSVHQWQACANGRYFVGICLDCDIAVNRLVLKYLRIPNVRALLRAYERRARAGEV